MRMTVHLLDADDAKWMLPLFEPGIEAWSRRRLGQLGMEAGVVKRSMKEIERMLAAGEPVSRGQVVERLSSIGVELDVQLRTHVFVTAVTSGIAAFGPDAQKGQPALMAREAWLGKAPRFDRERALEELTRRYFGAFGPATEKDFAGWAGLPLGECRKGMASLGSELREVDLAGERGWTLGAGRRAPAGPVVRLLPGWDNYLMGWRDRSFFATEDQFKKIGLGGGMLLPVVVRDGVAVGTWKIRRKGGAVSVGVEPFGRIDTATRSRVNEEIEDVARFEGLVSSRS